MTINMLPCEDFDFIGKAACNSDDFDSYLSKEMLARMLIYFKYRTFIKNDIYVIARDSARVPVSSDNINDIFTARDDAERDTLRDFEYDVIMFSYTRNLPVLHAREALYSVIYVNDGEVCCTFCGTYRYCDYDDILDMLIDERASGKYFVLLTDVDIMFCPVHEMFNEAICGFAVDNNRHEITIFDSRQAIYIYSYLFPLCSKLDDDTNGFQGDGRAYNNQYATEFFERIKWCSDSYDERSLMIRLGLIQSEWMYDYTCR